MFQILWESISGGQNATLQFSCHRRRPENDTSGKRNCDSPILPGTRHGLSLTTDGTNLYIAKFGRVISRYCLDGIPLEKFADVRGMAGASPKIPILESDVAGSVYASFVGQSSQPRTSFRLDQDGNISESFSHEDLVFPRGIDAAVNGDVYILNSAAVGVGNRLFIFNSNGTFVSDYSIPNTVSLSDIAINEVAEELYIADEFDDSIHVYDILSGVPIFGSTLSVPGRASDVFIEPISGRIFGTYYSVVREGTSGFLQYTGFEMSRNGSLLNLYVEDTAPRDQSVRNIVAVVLPEPTSALLIFVAFGLNLLRQRPKPFFLGR